MQRILSVIVPASNEEGYIGACLTALFASHPVPGGAEAVVVANGCRDATAARARDMAAAGAAAGWRLVVLDLPEGGKPGALNAGDRAAQGDMWAYLDADVISKTPTCAGLSRGATTSWQRCATAGLRLPGSVATCGLSVRRSTAR